MSLGLISEEIELLQKPQKGEVVEVILSHRQGRVKYQATSWPARLYRDDCQVAIAPGESVTIVGVEGITLLVMPNHFVYKPDVEHSIKWSNKLLNTAKFLILAMFGSWKYRLH